jgi:lipoate-protein ligase A
MGYPVLVRSSGGATAADRGTFGFSIIRPADEKESGRGIRERYDEAAALGLGAFSRLGVMAEVGEVRRLAPLGGLSAFQQREMWRDCCALERMPGEHVPL